MRAVLLTELCACLVVSAGLAHCEGSSANDGFCDEAMLHQRLAFATVFRMGCFPIVLVGCSLAVRNHLVSDGPLCIMASSKGSARKDSWYVKTACGHSD